MLSMFGDLTEAVVGLAVETPISIAAHEATMGGAIADKDEHYTATPLNGAEH